jgi:hypothetical protein
LFDINRNSEVEQLLRWDDEELVQLLSDRASVPDNASVPDGPAGAPERRFAMSLLTNITPEDAQVHVKSWLPGSSSPETELPGLYWPEDIYSLTHVALPFPPGDSLYGGRPTSESPGIKLGELALRGERGVLQISAAQMLRLRWNPFYPYLEQRVLEFLELD